MKLSARLVLFAVALLFSAVEMDAQESSTVRPRVVNPGAQDPQPQKSGPISQPVEASPLNPTLPSIEADPQKKIAGPITHLTPSLISSRISEAQRMLKTRPMATAMSVPSIQFVTIAALDRDTARTHLITLSKETFLTKGAEINTISSEGANVNLKILRANGVNTAMSIFTAEGKALAPLTVEYPIERGGKFLEMAYYTSAHPALLSKDLTRS